MPSVPTPITVYFLPSLETQTLPLYVSLGRELLAVTGFFFKKLMSSHLGTLKAFCLHVLEFLSCVHLSGVVDICMWLDCELLEGRLGSWLSFNPHSANSHLLRPTMASCRTTASAPSIASGEGPLCLPLCPIPNSWLNQEQSFSTWSWEWSLRNLYWKRGHH